MKTIVTPEKIIFKHLFYSLEIPIQSNIEFNFQSSNNALGLPAAMEIKSNKVEVKANIFGKLFYYLILLRAWWAKNILFWPFGKSLVSPTTITYTKNIEPFLNDLKNNKYQTEDRLNQVLDQIKNSKIISQKFVPGTVEWDKDKLALVALVFLFGEVIIGTIFFSWGLTIKSFITFLELSAGLFFICFLVYQFLANINKK